MAVEIKMGRLIAFLGTILLVGSCVESLMPQLNESDSENKLVVEGEITNEKGPFRVRLTASVPVNVNFYTKPVLDADIRIKDDKGNEYELYEAENGWYETTDKNLTGIPGNIYSLFITTGDGGQYQSSPVLMEDVPEIDSVYFEQVKKTRFYDGQAFEEDWLNILVDSRNRDGKTRYWRFEFDETWEVKMLSDYVMINHNPPDSPDNITWEHVTISEDKKTCWVTMPSGSIHVASTANSQLDELKGIFIQSLGPAEDKLHIRYSILVKQSAINRDLYDYWKKLMDVNEKMGSIYDKIPAPVYGNISSSNGASRVLGYFSASSVTKKRIFIDKTQHKIQTVSAYQGCTYFDYEPPPWVPKSYFGTIADTDTKVYCHTDFCADCQYYGTNEKPDFWK